jgi:hypothetical protein
MHMPLVQICSGTLQVVIVLQLVPQLAATLSFFSQPSLVLPALQSP